MKYYVDDIRNFGSGSNVKEIEANSPLEAAKMAFPDCKNYGRGYRTYVYNIE